MVRKPELWLKCIKLHVNDGVPMTKLAEQYNLDLSKLKYKVKVYLLHGESPFTDEQEKRVYTREEKLKAIKAILSGEKSGRQVALELAIPNPHIVQDCDAYEYKKGNPAAVRMYRGKYMIQYSWSRFDSEQL